MQEEGTIIDMSVFAPECEHCGRKEQEVAHASFHPRSSEVLKLLYGDWENLTNKPNPQAVNLFSLWIQRLLSDPMKYTASTHRGRLRDWSSYGDVVDGLNRLRTDAEQFPKGHVTFALREF